VAKEVDFFSKRKREKKKKKRI